MLESRPVYLAGEAVMKKAGRIDRRLTSEGRAIRTGETIVGVTAFVHEESVLTRNVDQFERIDDLDIESY